MRLSRLVAPAALMVSIVLPAGPACADKVIEAWSGSGLMTTRPITFSAPWEIQWDSGGFLQIFLLDETGQPVDILANQTEKGAGSSYVPRTGTFIIKFSGMAHWKAQAVLVMQ